MDTFYQSTARENLANGWDRQVRVNTIVDEKFLYICAEMIKNAEDILYVAAITMKMVHELKYFEGDSYKARV